jgi:hypothetical protein
LRDTPLVASGSNVTVYNLGGTITDRPVLKPRDDDGRWIGRSTGQWIDELTSAIIDYGAGGLIYLPFGRPESEIGRWVQEVVPEVHRAVGQ